MIEAFVIALLAATLVGVALDGLAPYPRTAEEADGLAAHVGAVVAVTFGLVLVVLL